MVAQPEQYQLFDALEPSEYDSLKADIAKRGVLVPIEFDEQGNVLDGHHRLRVCQELGLKDYPTVVRRFATEDEKEEHVVTLNVRRRHLNSEQKRRWAEWFLRRHPDWSDSRVASEVGLSHPTVAKVRGGMEERGEVERFTTRVGKDDKRQPASKPTPAPSIFTTSRGVDRATGVMQELGDTAPAQQLDLKRAERMARTQERERTAAAIASEPVPQTDADIRHGDFREVLADIADGSVDAIVTDPPYPQEFLPLYGDLSDHAARLLKPGGVLAVMVGQSYLDELLRLLGRSMTYHWTLAYLTPGGQAVQLWQRKVNTFWKPILVYTNGTYDGEWFGDVAKSATNDNDKRYHHWGQAESGMADLLDRLTRPGDLVIDPFVGGGTTAVVARDLGRRFIGCDISEESVTATFRRLAAA